MLGGVAAAAVSARRGSGAAREGLAFCAAPALWSLGMFSFKIGSDMGIRYVLFPLAGFYVLAGALGPWIASRSRALLLGFAVVLSAASVLRQSPGSMSYFNEAAGGARGGLRVLADSNLDWGQGLKELKSEMDRRGFSSVFLSYYGTVSPWIYKIDAIPLVERRGRPGLVAVSADHLIGMDAFNGDAPVFALPYANREPIGVAGGSIYLFEER